MKQFKTFRKTTLGWKPQSETGGVSVKKASEEPTKEELKETLKKHEGRETPAQEKAESPKEQEVERKAGVEKCASKLTSGERNKLPGGDFALPGRRYPIEDRAHAANAEARVAQHGTPAEKKEVDSKVHAKYPDMGEKKACITKLAGATGMLKKADGDAAAAVMKGAFGSNSAPDPAPASVSPPDSGGLGSSIAASMKRAIGR